VKPFKALRVAALFAAVTCGAARGEVYEGQTSDMQSFGSWGGVLTQRPGDFRFRAFTASGSWALYFDAFPPDCDITISVIDYFTTPATGDVARFEMDGTARIDQGDIFNLRLSTDMTMGDKAALFTVLKMPDVRSLINQMENGQVLRVKVPLDPARPMYVTFNLNGFGNAFQYEMNTCMAARAQALKQSKKEKPPKHPPGREQSL
jgi:hypothetical protein